MASAAQIRDKALKRMGVQSTSQTTQSEVQADLDAAYAEVYAELEAMDLTTWDLDEEIPDEFVHSVVALTAYHRIDEYSISNDRYSRISADASGAVGRIKELQASNVYKTPTAEYF